MRNSQQIDLLATYLMEAQEERSGGNGGVFEEGSTSSAYCSVTIVREKFINAVGDYDIPTSVQEEKAMDGELAEIFSQQRADIKNTIKQLSSDGESVQSLQVELALQHSNITLDERLGNHFWYRLY